MAAFTGSLRTNEIFGAIYNMIISQQVFSNPIAGGFKSLVDRARVDGSMYGDQKLYYSVDSLETLPYSPDTADQLNVLAVHRNKEISCQAIQMTVARQIPVTIDNYFSKRAFSTESVFADFNGVMLQWLRETKKVYDQTLYNSYIGTAGSVVGQQMQSVDISSVASPSGPQEIEAAQRIVAELIAEKIADLLVALQDPSRDFNDYQYLRSYDPSDIQVIWNSEWVNKLKKVDMPTIFHKDGLIDKFDEKNVLPARYFGSVNSSAGTTPSAASKVRSLVETWYNAGAEVDVGSVGIDSIPSTAVHVFPGDALPTATSYAANKTYTENGNIICKITAVDSVPYMSGFEVATEFVNSRNLSENHYLTFAHNELEYLKEKPMITVVATSN